MTYDSRIIAEHFARIVRDQLGEDLPEIIRRNATPEYEGSCATHDFCDANMLMEEAFTAAGCPIPDDYSEAWHAAWNAAWEIARDHNFAAQKEG